MSGTLDERMGRGRAPAAVPGHGRSLLRWLEAWAVWRDRARQRRHLMQLSDAMLKDIGVSRADVEHEAGKPMWRP